MTTPDELLRLACLTYDGNDGPQRWAEADRLLVAEPALADDLAVAAACGDVDRVRARLAREPDSVNAPTGPWQVPPLVYLCYARHSASADGNAAAATMAVLLEHGADPNAGLLLQGLVPPFTALTGLFGEGEGGPQSQPRHPHALRLARLLLEAGADPNDGQALYNRMFLPDDSHLGLLFEFGLGSGDGGPWRRRLPDALPEPADLLRDQLGWACAHGFTDRVRLLAAHGVDLTSPLRDGRTPVRLARECAQPRVVALLAELGVPEAMPVPIGPDSSEDDVRTAYLDALLTPDPDRVAELEVGRPGLRQAMRSAHPALVLRAAAAGNTPAVALLAGLGYDVSVRGRMDATVEDPWETPLHVAAWRGDAQLASALLAAGADPTLTDARFGSTPAGWARHAGHAEVAELLDRSAGSR